MARGRKVGHVKREDGTNDQKKNEGRKNTWHRRSESAPGKIKRNGKNEGWVLFSLEPQLMQRRNSLSDLFLTFSNTPISPSPNPPLDSCVSTLLCWGCLLCNYFNNFASIPGIKSSWIVGVQALGRTGQKCPLVNSLTINKNTMVTPRLT